MLHISEICIISIDKGEDSWAIEGEVLFEDDLNAAFEVTYLPDEDELENLQMDETVTGIDPAKLKEMIVAAAMDYED